MPYDNLRRRIHNAEGRNPKSNVILVFQDGSTRGLTLKHKTPLGMFCAACSLQTWKAGPPEGEQPSDFYKGPMPTTEFDHTMQLFARAVSVKSDNHFLQLVHQMCVEAFEREKGEDAHTFLTRMGRKC
jgi:hypothetical protein